VVRKKPARAGVRSWRRTCPALPDDDRRCALATRTGLEGAKNIVLAAQRETQIRRHFGQGLSDGTLIVNFVRSQRPTG